MRYTPTLKLSTRLVAFVTMIVIIAMFILFLGGTLSFRSLGQQYLDQSLQGIVEVVDKEMEDPDAAYSLQRWMPKMLQASNIVEMELSSSYGVIYRFKDTSSKVEPTLLYQRSYPLERNVGYQINFKAVPPYIGYGYSLQAMWSITMAIGLVIFCLMQGVKWLKEQLSGSERLEERGRMILAGRVEEYAKGDPTEWPYTASQALDTLIEELQDARQERSRFDAFIRTQTFLDQLTGTANRVLFDSKLESALSESGSRGGILLLRVDDWALIREEYGEKLANDFLIEVGEGLNNVIQRYPDLILSRYYQSDFAIFAPHLSNKEVANLASAALKQLAKLTPPNPLDKDNWVHIGVSMYHEGESQGRIIDEAETALKSAQLQGNNTWSRFNKHTSPEEDRGSVRWRTLLDMALAPDKLLVFAQPCYLLTEQQETQLDHFELFARINDPEKGVLKASRFISAVESVGYGATLDKSMLTLVIKRIKSQDSSVCYSLNLDVTPFAEREYFKWFRDELLQLTIAQRGQLMFEFSEARLVKHLDYMRPVIKVMSGLGCRVTVGQAGRSIVSTHYLKDLSITYLKLHRGLVKQIEQRHENQLYIRSMLGACADKETQVIAVGVDNKLEFRTLLSLGVEGVQGRYFEEERQLIPERSATQSTSAPPKVQVGRRNRWRKTSS